ncbi:MAG: hypothetical protein OXG10_03005 [Candidatus Dadabacteria bacterium]|nr:hypothetical protein [Candidatus Dadabacteria bacterium]
MKYLSMFLLMMFVFSGCGGGGDNSSDIARIEGERAALYSLYAKDSSGENNNDGFLSEDEIDCNHPLFTRKEPLPEGGTHPEAVVSPAGTYWDCQGSKEYLHADGSTSATAKAGYEEEQEFWSVCMIGTEPPEIKGDWVATQDGQLCARTDTLPGIVVCVDYEVNTSGDGEKSLTTGGNAAVYHDGQRQLLPFLEESVEETCYLREQPDS